MTSPVKQKIRSSTKTLTKPTTQKPALGLGSLLLSLGLVGALSSLGKEDEPKVTTVDEKPSPDNIVTKASAINQSYIYSLKNVYSSENTNITNKPTVKSDNLKISVVEKYNHKYLRLAIPELGESYLVDFRIDSFSQGFVQGNPSTYSRLSIPSININAICIKDLCNQLSTWVNTWNEPTYTKIRDTVGTVEIVEKILAELINILHPNLIHDFKTIDKFYSKFDLVVYKDEIKLRRNHSEATGATSFYTTDTDKLEALISRWTNQTWVDLRDKCGGPTAVANIISTLVTKEDKFKPSTEDNLIIELNSLPDKDQLGLRWKSGKEYLINLELKGTIVSYQQQEYSLRDKEAIRQLVLKILRTTDNMLLIKLLETHSMTLIIEKFQSLVPRIVSSIWWSPAHRFNSELIN
jgi:hypothetical protein